MKIEKAKDLLLKIKKIENNYEFKNAFQNHKFVMIPFEYFQKNNIEINWYDIWDSNENIIGNNHNSNFELVILQRSNFVIGFSTNLELLKTFL